MSLDGCKLVRLPTVENAEGDLSFAEAERHVPFPIARVFYVYDVPVGSVRGEHAHRELDQVVFCVAGSFQIEVDDGFAKRTFTLDDPRVGLRLPPMVWHRIEGFAPGTVYLVLTSAAFDERDYIRDHDRYLALVRPGDAAPAGEKVAPASP